MAVALASSGKYLRAQGALGTGLDGWVHAQWVVRKRSCAFELNSTGLSKSSSTSRKPGFTIVFRLLGQAGATSGHAAMPKASRRRSWLSMWAQKMVLHLNAATHSKPCHREWLVA